MKIISYNVNGIRAAQRKGLSEWIQQAQPDVLCIQETKANIEQVDITPFEELGYTCYFHSAQKKGYSGVAIFTKEKPKQIVYGTNIPYVDNEGRVLQVDFEEVSIISVYVPSGTNMDRLDYKMQFCEDFSKHIQKVQQSQANLVICGDYNICKEAIDIHDPIRNKNVSGFLPIEREWLAKFIKDRQLIDSFRHFNVAPHQYSWWSYRANARNNNKGWRIDYAMVSNALENKLSRAFILPEAKHSDHCPVGVELDI